MEEAASSPASSVDFYETDNKVNTPQQPSNDTSVTKRKAEGFPATQENQEKKRKVETSSPSTRALKPCAGLPPAIWQHIFLSCSLSDLGRLLQVNRSFHSFLTDVRSVSHHSPGHGFLRLLKSESIWASVRNALPVKPPKPLPGFSELQTWRLVWSRRCQFCHKESSFKPGERIWQKGPGADGIRTIWPFGVRACGTCLMERCQTDANLLFSSASALRPALPFAFITNDRNYVPAYTLQAATTPAGVDIAKYYYREHVEGITKELNDALSLGPAAAEEWSKGLEARGIERMKMAENWERWEVKYQWWSDHHGAKHATPAAPSPPASHKEPSRSPTCHTPSPIIHAPVPATPAPHYMQTRPPTVPLQYTPHPAPGSVQPRGERNLHDANEAKASRKADIERRCQQLDPPIQPGVLRHMESFKAAIQISQPMTEHAWSVLQPRLLAQLPAAQQAEADHVSHVATQLRATDRRHLDPNSKEAKEIMDREWEESQRPLRDRLSAIADDFVNQDWDRGRAVTYENSPKFAVDLLMYVRRIFYADLAKEEKTPGQEQFGATTGDVDNPTKPGLVLENMKWVYDNKIKPLTEQYRKELFLCYGNGCEGNTRFYGFEGVIQHFGAKHTNTFSVGNVVVAWREAEWPEETPFHPDPISVKHVYPSTSGHAGYGAYYGGYSRAGTSTPHVQAHLPQASPGPYHYGAQYNGPFAPPQPAPSATSGYDYAQSYGAPVDAYQYQSMAPPGYGTQPVTGYMTSPAMSAAAIAPPPVVPAQGSGTNDTSPKADGAEHRTSLFDKQVSTVIEMAKDIWTQTSGIKDLPPSLRIYVLLQRVISKFHVEFNHEPTLNHFIEAFPNHEIPRALKNAPGLSCKACQHELSQFPSRQEERKIYTASNLLSHFHSQHTAIQASGYGTGQLAPLDWKEDMIELPSDRFISGLIHAPGMDDDKLLMIATVFPRLFPTPLPKIGVVDSNGVASMDQSVPKESKDAPMPGATQGAPAEISGPSSLASPFADSPRPSKNTEDEYDPQRPALPAHANQSTRSTNRKHSYRASPPHADRRPRYYAEPRYYLSGEPLDDEYSRPREYLDYAPSPRRFRDSGPFYEEYHERRPVYRDHETFYHSGHDEVIYAQAREGVQVQDFRPSSRQVRYLEEESGRPEYRYLREPKSREPSPSEGKSAADRFLDEFVPGQPSTSEHLEQDTVPGPQQKTGAGEQDPEDGSRYTPPPPDVPPADDGPEQHRATRLAHPTAPSTVSNGSRYEEFRPTGRQVPTPDPARGPRRPGPHRRRDRFHDHIPSRYYRYMSVARDEPYSRGASMSRTQSKRYERYEEQRRRIDQQETPQPNADQDLPYSRDHSVDQGATEDSPYQMRQAPREYVSVQDRLHPYSPPRYRYAGYPEESRGPQPVYVDRYGQRIGEYEYIRVPRDPRQARGPYMSHPPAGRYLDHEPEHFQYYPVPYDRPLAQRYEGRPEYVYYEERERPPPARRPVFEPEDDYEPPPPPPEIKVETPAPLPEGP